jgi:hypothetical protein
MTGIPDLTPGLEDVSVTRFETHFRGRLTMAQPQNIYKYLLLDINTQWSAQLDKTSQGKTRIVFNGRRKPVVIVHSQWKANQTHTDWKSFHEELERRYPDTMQDTTRILFCYAVVHRLLDASAVPVEGLRRSFVIDIRKLRTLLDVK